jgi:predicted GH43/DUF377 family glycosyl hydrolase
VQVQDILYDNVVMRPDSQKDIFGIEDPRIAYNPGDGLFYIFFTQVANESGNHVAHLSLYVCALSLLNFVFYLFFVLFLFGLLFC